MFDPVWIPVWVTLIGQCGIITAIIVTAVLNHWLSIRQHSQTMKSVEAVADEVKVVHAETNHLKDELVAATKSASFAEGAKSEKDKKEGVP